jgi:hypothetical protein
MNFGAASPMGLAAPFFLSDCLTIGCFYDILFLYDTYNGGES